jgi:cytochrome b561
MSDEPKERSWAWVWWAARIGWTALALLMLYAASFPPVIGWALIRNQGDVAISFYRASPLGHAPLVDLSQRDRFVLVELLEYDV